MERNHFAILVFNNGRNIHASQMDIAILFMGGCYADKQESANRGESRGERERRSKTSHRSHRKWTGNPPIIAKESLIQKGIAPYVEEHLHEREIATQENG